jgi:ATP-dependent DNA ligase
MSRTSTLPKRLQPMRATLTEAPFDDAEWVFEDKYYGLRMVARTHGGKVTLYSRNGKIISQNYIEVRKRSKASAARPLSTGNLLRSIKAAFRIFSFCRTRSATRQSSSIARSISCSWTERICAASPC